MPNYDELKKIAKDALETIADVSVEAYRLAEEKTKVLAKRAKLVAEITHERALIRRAKFNIGGVYYELHRDAPEEEMKLYCDKIAASIELIAANQREIEELKRGPAPCCDAESESCYCEEVKEEDSCGCGETEEESEEEACSCGCGSDETPKD